MNRRSLIFAVAISACAGSELSDVGRVEASLTAAPGSASPGVGAGNSLGVKEIIVTIDKVTAHSTTAGWVTIADTDVKVDILKLQQSAQSLGFSNVPAGKITQLRLYVLEGGEQYVTRNDGQRIDLKVPSGIQSGIKLKGLFDVNGCQASNVPLQFDGKKSIWVHPTGGEDLWILRPVIHTGKVQTTAMTCPTPTTPTTPGGTGGGGGSDNPGNPTDPLGEGTPPPGPGGSGTVCTTGSGCLSGVCTNGFCGKGGADAPCNVAADCTSGTCTAGACTTPPNTVGSGGACSANAVCLSGSCVNGICNPGGQGQPCATVADCSSGLACTAGSCLPQIN